MIKVTGENLDDYSRQVHKSEDIGLSNKKGRDERSQPIQ